MDSQTRNDNMHDSQFLPDEAIPNQIQQLAFYKEVNVPTLGPRICAIHEMGSNSKNLTHMSLWLIYPHSISPNQFTRFNAN